MKNLMSAFFLCVALFSACYCTEGGETDKVQAPVVKASVLTTAASGATFSFSSFNALGAAVQCVKATESAPSARGILADGERVEFDQAQKDPRTATITVSGLEENTAYIAYCIAFGEKDLVSSVQQVVFSTAEGAIPYKWEASRTALPTYDNLDLIYGGSQHRLDHGLWDQNRFARHVTYTDANGTERWLFDAFLAIEFVMTQFSGSTLITNANGRNSAGQEAWQALIDYWFTPGQGFDALDKAVGAAKTRLGNPPKTRKVVMTLPDAIPLAEYNNLNSTSIYWGTLDGVKMDFSKPGDRLAALKWYIDQVRKKWNDAGYRNLEFAGFYIINEAIATSKYGGWGPEFTRWDEILPAISKYLHSVNEPLSWIPYYQAYGWSAWEAFEIDYVQMQPNYFWGNNSKFSKSGFKNMLDSAKISMELELDDAILNKSANSEPYRSRFREYMSMARDFGLYGTREFSYYLADDTLNNLAKSSDPEDVQIFQELCGFVSANVR